MPEPMSDERFNELWHDNRHGDGLSPSEVDELFSHVASLTAERDRLQGELETFRTAANYWWAAHYGGKPPSPYSSDGASDDAAKAMVRSIQEREATVRELRAENESLRAALASRQGEQPIAYLTREAAGYRGVAPHNAMFIHERPRRWKPDCQLEQWVSSRGSEAKFDDRQAELLGVKHGECRPLYLGPPLQPAPALEPVYRDDTSTTYRRGNRIASAGDGGPKWAHVGMLHNSDGFTIGSEGWHDTREAAEQAAREWVQGGGGE